MHIFKLPHRCNSRLVSKDFQMSKRRRFKLSGGRGVANCLQLVLLSKGENIQKQNNLKKRNFQLYLQVNTSLYSDTHTVSYQRILGSSLHLIYIEKINPLKKNKPIKKLKIFFKNQSVRKYDEMAYLIIVSVNRCIAYSPPETSDRTWLQKE